MRSVASWNEKTSFLLFSSDWIILGISGRHNSKCPSAKLDAKIAGVLRDLRAVLEAANHCFRVICI